MNLAAPPHKAIVESAEDNVYRLIAVESVATPEGCVGGDWFVYRIAQGVNAITGYRRGDHASVSGDAATIVVALNERRDWNKIRVSPKERRKNAAAARAAAAAES